MFTEITIFGASGTPASFVLIFTAVACATYAYVRYYLHTLEDVIRPNPWSWGIWGVTTLVEAITYNAFSEDWIQSLIFYWSAICCLVVTYKVLRTGKPQWPTLTEWLSVVATLAALVVWLVFHETWWAHFIMIVAVPISFFPIWAETWNEPHKEHNASWVWWSIGDLLAFILILTRFSGDGRELWYAGVEFACHFGMLLIVIGRQSRHGKRANTLATLSRKR